MGIKKYEIITVGRDKRVRALRSWQVQDRYVNIGDVGGIVYDEKTLSQDGACWLFRGNFGFPGARIGGDSVVDVKEGALAPRNYNVDILGSSTFVGGEVRFNSNMGAEDNVTLTAADFEQGGFGYGNPWGTNWENWKVSSPNYVRTVKPIFAGGVPTTLKLDIPGYKLDWFTLDRDGNVIATGGDINSGAGVTTVIPACQSFMFRLSKVPIGAIVPADATAAEIKYTQVYEGSLTIIDSRVEINPPTSNTYITWVSAGVYTEATGVSFQTVIRGTTLKINRDGAANSNILTVANLINSTVTIDSAANPQVFGVYENVKNLIFSGSFSGLTYNPSISTLIQAHNCDNIVVNATNLPGLAAMQTAGVPIKFYSCNLNTGRFYHHAQIANTYRDVNFDLATKDLGKMTANEGTVILCSSEVNGMYRLHAPSGSGFGALVESHESVKSVNLALVGSAYGTTIYKDAYVSGKFDFAGINVFGNTKKHDTQDVSGCKIVNTGETAVNMKGNIRVEGNATLTNCSIIGSGYFGGKAVASGLLIEGSVFMSDNASFTKTGGAGVIRNLKMTDNAAAVVGDVPILGNIGLYDNSVFKPTSFGNAEADISMYDNATVTSSLSLGGKLTMKDDATVSAGQLLAVGDITICGSYKQTAPKTWTGKRVIASQDAPQYDDNVKTKYDF